MRNVRNVCSFRACRINDIVNDQSDRDINPPVGVIGGVESNLIRPEKQRIRSRQNVAKLKNINLLTVQEPYQHTSTYSGNTLKSVGLSESTRLHFPGDAQAALSQQPLSLENDSYIEAILILIL